MKVLIVDDNPGIRRLLRRVLCEIATSYVECSDGAEALAVYSGQLPDVVLMDIRMPNVDGLKATRQIRNFDPNARVIIVTDFDDPEVRSTALEAGACGYSLKQNLTDLPRLVSSVVGKDKGSIPGA